MGKLHELLAVEKTLLADAEQLIKDTTEKFIKREHFFIGEEKTLTMLKESPENTAEEKAARSSRQLTTTVVDTLDFMFQVWGKAEDVLYQKNMTNTTSFADIEYRGEVIAKNIPVDELMGLESRLSVLKEAVFKHIPTVDASKQWMKDQNERKGVLITEPERTTKTQKIMVPVILYGATKEHPAQVKEATKDEVVGTFERLIRTGAATAVQKSDALLAITDLIAEVKKARMRANSVEAVNGKIADTIIKVLMEPFKE